MTRAWSPTGLIPWFSKTKGYTCTALLHHPFLFKGKPTQCSRGSKKDLWRRCRGDSRQVKSRFYSHNKSFLAPLPSQNIPSTHHKLLSLALHYLPFASRFPLPHFTLAVSFTLFFLSLSFRSPSLFLFAFLPVSCLLVCWIACLSRWLYLDLVIFTLKG